MSADTHTSTPRRGEDADAGVDERYAARTLTGRPGHLATVPPPDTRLAHVAAADPASLRPGHPAQPGSLRPGHPAQPVEHTPVTWAQDSGRPRAGERAPRLRAMLGVCGWAALLGGVGLVVAIRGFVAVLWGETPSWYEPAMIGVGVLGIGLTVGAFATVHRRRLPYLLLAAATAVLAYSLLLTITAL